MNDNFYRAFEDRYRGSRKLVKQRLEVYLPFITPLSEYYPDAPALDLGCGRGEWLEMLKAACFTPSGVDLDQGMLDACHELGLVVKKGEAIACLSGLPDESHAIISAFHVVEHISFDQLRTLVIEALRVLKPGGILIMETPNPENIVVATRNFYLDPTHQRPIPPDLLSFVPEYYGFKRVKTIRLQESKELVQQEAPSLQAVLDGVSPDYAVVAQKNADPKVLSASANAFDKEYGLTLEVLSARYDNSIRSKMNQAEAKAEQAEAKAEQAEAKAEQAEAKAEQAEDQIEQAQALVQAGIEQANIWHEKILALHGSTSWRITKPFRLLRRLLAGDLSALNRLTTLEDRAKLVGSKLTRSLLLTVNRLLQPHLQLKQKISYRLFQNFPQIHHWLRLAIQKETLAAKKIQQQPAFERTPTLLKVPAAFSDPTLANLARPVNLQNGHACFNATFDNNILNPVVELDQMRQSAASICFVVPIIEHDRSSLERTLQSVLRQTDPAWELILCAPSHLQNMAEEWLDVDWRIRWLARSPESNRVQDIFQATVQSTADFMGLLAQGDVVDDDLLKLIGQKVCIAPLADVIYTDEIYCSDNNKLIEPFYKPDWSPEHQYSVNMLGSFLAIRKSLLLNLTLSTTGAPEAIEYELSLAVTRRARHIAHIDEALYIHHAAPLARLGGFFSPLALEDARNILERHLREDSPEVQVVACQNLGSLHVNWPVKKNVPVTLLILTGMQKREIPGHGKVVLATNFVRSIIEKSTFNGYRIIVVDDGFVPDDLRILLQEHGHTTHTYPKDPVFSFARKANFASSLITSGIAILLNDDLEVISNDWIEALASQAARSEVGAVGGKLLFGDGLLQHAGIGLGFNGAAGHMFHRTINDGNEYGGFASIDRNYSAVTGAVLAYRKEIFDEVGGFDEQFQTDYNDLDFCLKCIKHGYRIVYTPAATLYHFHNSSFKRMHDKQSEREAFLDRWSEVVNRDPYFSKHFQTKSCDLPLLEA